MFLRVVGGGGVEFEEFTTHRTGVWRKKKPDLVLAANLFEESVPGVGAK